MSYIYTMKYLSVIKKNESHVFAGKLMQMEMIILRQLGQYLKDKYFTHSWWFLDFREIHKVMHTHRT